MSSTGRYGEQVFSGDFGHSCPPPVHAFVRRKSSFYARILSVLAKRVNSDTELEFQ